MHQPPITEFEEVKPNSIAGRAAGRVKVGALQAFYSGIPLPYMAGTTYTPPPPFVIVNGSIPVPVIGTVPFKVSFRISRDRAGLLVYDICVETDWLKASALAIAIVILIILALIAGGVIGPVPIPTPAPIPAFAANTPESGPPAEPGSADSGAGPSGAGTSPVAETNGAELGAASA
jgi:hypothetical protein